MEGGRRGVGRYGGVEGNLDVLLNNFFSNGSIFLK
jgi:hypothetical protein